PPLRPPQHLASLRAPSASSGSRAQNKTPELKAQQPPAPPSRATQPPKTRRPRIPAGVVQSESIALEVQRQPGANSLMKHVKPSTFSAGAIVLWSQFA